MTYTLLVPHASEEKLFSVFKDAVSKYAPNAGLLVADKDRFPDWGQSIEWLINNCKTDVGVFIDDDCILLNDIEGLVQQVESGEADMVGVEGVIQLKDGRYLRNHKGYYDLTFMVLNIKKFVDEFGRDAFYPDMEQARKEIHEGLSIERFYGISQHMRGKKIVKFDVFPTDYGMATSYWYQGLPMMVHLWYGAWKHRNAERDGISPTEMEERERRFIDDYIKDTLKI